MINRKIEKRIRNFFQKDHNALLITGARQVGKTYIIREICLNCFSPMWGCWQPCIWTGSSSSC